MVTTAGTGVALCVSDQASRANSAGMHNANSTVATRSASR